MFLQNKFTLKIFCASFILFACGFQAIHATQPKASYLTVSEGEKTIALQTAARRFVAPGKPSIWIVSVTHIGTPDYYGRLQSLLNSSSKVYFEGVRPSDDTPLDHLARNAALRTVPSTERSSGIQSDLAEALDLVFQLDAIDYMRSTFYNIDTSVPTLLTTFRNKGISSELIEMLGTEGLSWGNRLAFSAFCGLMRFDTMRASMTYVFIKLFSDANLEGILMHEDFKDISEIILTERNQYVYDYLKKDLATNTYTERDTIALFYGAAHASGLEKLISQLDYTLAPNIPPAQNTLYFDAFYAQLDEISGRATLDEIITATLNEMVNESDADDKIDDKSL